MREVNRSDAWRKRRNEKLECIRVAASRLLPNLLNKMDEVTNKQIDLVEQAARNSCPDDFDVKFVIIFNKYFVRLL